MPHLIISTVAILSNLYKNAPLIVGDKDSDPDLMRFLGARITTNYPACGSPPMYVMHAPPRTVFDNLEKRGYCLMSAQTIQEHSVWILARPRVPDDDKVEIARGGPNDKSIQAFDDPDSIPAPPPSRSPSGSRARSPNKPPRLTVTRSSSRRSVNEDTILNPSRLKNVTLNRERSDSRKSSLMENQAVYSSYEKSSSQADEDSLLRKSPQLDNQSYVIANHPSKVEKQTVSIVTQISQEEMQSKEGKQASSIISQLFDSKVDEDSLLRKSSQIENQSHENDIILASPDRSTRDKSPNSVMFSVQFRESSPRRRSSHRVKKTLDNQKLSVQIVEKEQRRKSSRKAKKKSELQDSRSQSVSPDKRVIRNISPNSQNLIFHVPDNFSIGRSSQRDKKSLFPNNLKLSVQVRENSPGRNNSLVKEKQALFEFETCRSRSISPEKRHTSPYDPNIVKDTQQAQKRKLAHKDRPYTRICTENEPCHSRSASPPKRIDTDQENPHGRSHKEMKNSFGQEDSEKILPSNQKDPGNVTSKGDAGTHWLESEKVHMGIQASDSEVSLKKSCDIISRVSFCGRKHADILKNSDESAINFSQNEASKIRSALKRTASSSKQIQADFDCDPLVKPWKPIISVHFANPKEGLDIDKPLILDSSVHDQSRIIDLSNLPSEDTCQYATGSETDEVRHFRNVEELTITNEGSVFKDSVILRSLASRCSHIAIVDDIDAPVFIDITDPNNLACLTHENCCCEDK